MTQLKVGIFTLLLGSISVNSFAFGVHDMEILGFTRKIEVGNVTIWQHNVSGNCYAENAYNGTISQIVCSDFGIYQKIENPIK